MLRKIILKLAGLAVCVPVLAISLYFAWNPSNPNIYWLPLSGLAIAVGIWLFLTSRRDMDLFEKEEVTEKRKVGFLLRTAGRAIGVTGLIVCGLSALLALAAHTYEPPSKEAQYVGVILEVYEEAMEEELGKLDSAVKKLPEDRREKANALVKEYLEVLHDDEQKDLDRFRELLSEVEEMGSGAEKAPGKEE